MRADPVVSTASEPAPSSRTPQVAFWIARLGSQAAMGLFFGALYLNDGSAGSAGVLSSLVVAMLAASILFGLPAGALADRIGPARGLALGAVLRATAIAMGLAVLGRPEWAWAVAFTYSAASQIYSSSEMALVRQVQPERPNRGHASLVGLQYAGHGAALLIGPALFMLAGAEALIAGAVLLYLPVTAAALKLAEHYSDREAAAAAENPPRLELGRGLRLLLTNRSASYATGVLAFADLATRSLLLAVPLFLREELGFSTGTMATLGGVAVVGVVLGLVWSARARATHRARLVMRAAVWATALSALILALVTPSAIGVAVAIPTFLVLGLCFSLAPIAARTTLTRSAATGEQASVFATQAVLTDVLVIVPLALAGTSAELLGPQSAMVFVAVAAFVMLPVLERLRRLPERSLPLLPAPSVSATPAVQLAVERVPIR